MAQSVEVKTLQKFASVKSSISGPTIQTIALSKSRNILMISNGSEFLYLVVEHNVAVSIHLRPGFGMGPFLSKWIGLCH